MLSVLLFDPATLPSAPINCPVLWPVLWAPCCPLAFWKLPELTCEALDPLPPWPCRLDDETPVASFLWPCSLATDCDPVWLWVSAKLPWLSKLVPWLWAEFLMPDSWSV